MPRPTTLTPDQRAENKRKAQREAAERKLQIYFPHSLLERVKKDAEALNSLPQAMVLSIVTAYYATRS
jgi:hypothetical protein